MDYLPLFVCLTFKFRSHFFREKRYFVTKGWIETTGWKGFLDAVWPFNTGETLK